MESNNKHNTFNIVISILGALLIWFSANVSVEVPVTVNDIPVEFLHEDTALADKGLMIVGEKEAYVDLVLRMKRSVVYRLDKSRIRITADLASIHSTGLQTLSYTIVYPSEVLFSDIKVESPTSRTVTVQIGELFRKEVEIRCKVEGSVAKGYLAGSVQLLPENLEISGEQIDVMQVNYAQVTLNIDDAKSTIVELLNFELYDFNNQLIRSDRIHPACESIQVTMPVVTVKDVPLVIDFVEAPGARLKDMEWELTTDSVTLSGDSMILATVGELTLDSLAVEELKEGDTFTYQIPVPDALRNLSGIGTTTLTILSHDIAEEEIEVTNFGYENLSSERTVSIVTSTIPVVVRGTSEALETLATRSLRAVADLSDISDADGIYTVPATIYADEDLDIGAVGSYSMTVRLSAEADDAE